MRGRPLPDFRHEWREQLILLGCRICGCGQLLCRMLQTSRNHSRPRLLLCIQPGHGCSGSVWDPHPQEDTSEVKHLDLSIPLRNTTSEGSTDRGTPVRCGQAIRLTHLGTGRNLHSHRFTSPLSGNQEVSAFGEAGEGDYLDDWTVVCSGTYWVRDDEVRFQHTSTDVFLSVTGEQYGRPIHGQKEVHGMAASSQNNYWKVMEGIFMQPSEAFQTEQYHAEL
uniref:Stromal cell derived factor 2 n=1 Tax=Serinus canaria TaxID=9135 RepID=A0A8C9MVN3_SERCA